MLWKMQLKLYHAVPFSIQSWIILPGSPISSRVWTQSSFRKKWESLRVPVL